MGLGRPIFCLICGDGLSISETKVDALIRPVVERMGYELWGCEYHAAGRHGILRVFIDRDEGVTLDDCALVSAQVSAMLDVEDPIQGSYDLEVSSPGMDRPLLLPDHYRRLAGSLVKIRLAVPVAGRRNVKGRLLGLEDMKVCIETDGEVLHLPFADVVSARVVPEW